MKIHKNYEEKIIMSKIPKKTKDERILYGKQSEINFVYHLNDRGLNIIFNNDINCYDIDCLETSSNTFIDVKRRNTYILEELNNEECLYVEIDSIKSYIEKIEKLPKRYHFSCILAFDISKDQDNIDFAFIDVKKILDLKADKQTIEKDKKIYFPMSKTCGIDKFVQYINKKKKYLYVVNENKLIEKIKETKQIKYYTNKKLDNYSYMITTDKVAFWYNKIRRVKDNTNIDERLTSDNCMIFSKQQFEKILEIYNSDCKKTDLWICFDIKHETLMNELRFLKFSELLINFNKEIKPTVWEQSNGKWMNTLKTDCITEMEFDQKYLKKYI